NSGDLHLLVQLFCPIRIQTVQRGRTFPCVRTYKLRCQCLQTVSGLVSPKLLVRVEIIPKGPQCSTVEVIATLKTSQQICLDPQAKWVKMIINRILRR
uniref:C-X-C motif chemokine n=1 Tax=Chelonoidis abingdonii TaxID=106734 RepID=A0A8C0GAI1_CHEAB